ncbi:MAG: DUF411 domain-containing protein [Gammaproteobacteria bacterium]|nr:DUF411 domain-containing protein [Gammaproteobacteria bacterium]MBU1645548.1 DUF411 domain-containing protein [Gammaproteobacteria bacterium]MBU1973650.1 DUF411 domain-containing protein [Gammaproteobacteria bacterium]
MLKLIAALALFASSALPQGAAAETLPLVEVHLPKICLACIDWSEHLIKHGFKVKLKSGEDMAAVKRRLKVPADLESVHTATVGGYFIEGHVPAEDIVELLREKPKARGLAVPGLPMGAPGREARGTDASCESGCIILEGGAVQRIPRREFFNTLLVLPDGTTKVFARH